MPTTKTVSNVRQRVHEGVRADIVDQARQQLAANGAAALSLRAVARELGMASSAIYRYFQSRDELLTALIVDAYDSMGAVAEDAAASGGGSFKRLRAVSRAVRGWALEHPHEYGLVYGTPVPGYLAPQLTVEPASRVSLVLARLVLDAHRAGELDLARVRPIPRALTVQTRPLEVAVMPGVPLWIVARALVAWALLFGQINFEVFGRLDDVVQDREVLFEFTVTTIADILGMSQPSAEVQTSTRHTTSRRLARAT
ncbi:MAG: TetR/AcrR family transcriptional regulator [Acidimicrobiales bacterium]|jgi:AcrR family transcriptional regulator